MTAVLSAELHQTCHQILQRGLRLRLRLERPEQGILAAEVHEEIRQIMAPLDDLSVEGDPDWVGLRAIMEGLVKDLVLQSAWSRTIHSPQTIANLTDRVTPGEILEHAKTISGDSESAMLFFYVLSLVSREPNADYDGIWASEMERLLRQMELKIGVEAFHEEVLTPDAAEGTLRQSPVPLKIVEETPLDPKGEAGDAWQETTKFFEDAKIRQNAMPWLLLIGPAKSGKTTLLQAPEPALTCVTTKRLIQNPSTEIEGWVLKDTGFVYDVPSRYTDVEAGEAELDQWRHLLGLLRTHRPRRPLDGLVLTIDLPSLMDEERAVEDLANYWRQRLLDVYRTARLRFPVYVVFTKLDAIYGFRSFSGRLTAMQRRSIFGFSHTGELTEAMDLETQLDTVTQRVRDFDPLTMVYAADEREAQEIFAFPNEFKALRPMIQFFLERLFQVMGDEPLFFGRGVYFVSNIEQPPAVIRHFAWAEGAIEAEPSVDEETDTDPVFVDELFANKLFAERNLTLPSLEPALQEKDKKSWWSLSWLSWLKRLTSSAVGILILALLIALLFWVVGAYRELRDMIYIDTPEGHSFVLVPAGDYVMGSPASDEMRYVDELPHEVALTKPFYVGRYEVTQAQWVLVTDQSPSFFKGADYPVETVSWLDSASFIAKLNKISEGGRYDFLTEAEWEYACRAGAEKPLPDNIDAMAWYEVTSQLRTHPVGERAPNAWRLHDMQGNAAEWVGDKYGPYQPGRAQDPTGPSVGELRVNRGGAFFDEIRTIRAANRARNMPDFAFRGIGLRLAWRPDENSAQGQYLAEHAGRVKAYWTMRRWLGDNQDLVAAALSGSADWIGGGLSSAWDAIAGLFGGSDDGGGGDAPAADDSAASSG